MLFDIYDYPNFSAGTHDFFSVYEIEQILYCPNEKLKISANLTEQICRFCGASKVNGNASFGDKAHVIPQFLGNRYLISDFECDSCNHKFGKSFEQDFKRYLGVIPTATKTPNFNRKKNLVPKHKHASAYNIAETVPKNILDDEPVIIKKQFLDSHLFCSNSPDGRISTPFIRESYRPFGIYQTLLKMAICCLPYQEVAMYKDALCILQTNALPTEVENQTEVCIMELDAAGCFGSTPTLLLFKNRDANNSLAEHVFALYYKQFIFQMALPLIGASLSDPEFSAYCPPLSINVRPEENVLVEKTYKNCYSNEVVKDHIQLMTFREDGTLSFSM